MAGRESDTTNRTATGGLNTTPVPKPAPTAMSGYAAGSVAPSMTPPNPSAMSGWGAGSLAARSQSPTPAVDTGGGWHAATPVGNGASLAGAHNPHEGVSVYTPDPPAVNTAPPGEGYGPGTGETYGLAHLGQYDTPTDLETFAQQQLQGNNPYYDRLRQQGMDAINQQMAARGHYNSGGALSSLGNFAGALGAEQFKSMGDLLGSAGTMQLNRQGQGQSTANGIQSQKQQRMGQQWGQLSDIAHLGAGNVGGFYGQGGQMSGDAAMAGINARTNAAGLQGQGQSAFSSEGLGILGKIIGS